MKTRFLIIIVFFVVFLAVAMFANFTGVEEMEDSSDKSLQTTLLPEPQYTEQNLRNPLPESKPEQTDPKPKYIKSFPLSTYTNNQNYGSDIAIDSDGFLYVTHGNNSIEKYDSDGNLKMVFGHPGTPYDRDLYSTLGYMVNPYGIAVDDHTGTLYVTDLGNNRVQYFDSNGTAIGAWGNHGTQEGKFDVPQGIAIDEQRNLVYVVDAGNNRIQVFDKNGKFGNSFGNGGPQKGHFNSPNGIYVDNGNVYISERGNDRIQVFDKDMDLIAIKTEFVEPLDVTVDSAGNVYVLTNAGRFIGLVEKYDSNWNKQYTLTTRDFSDKYIPFEEYDIGFENIWSVAVDSDAGLLYVLDRSQGIHVFEE
jgi:DNA-binding beta-propeller fold protein YncE